ncbi:LysM domain-containing protein [Prosthecobacter fusiformis]|uniref:LysM domain-containing protein n=1 Tax=Prosthecobacter fusiformis TaxID=48464 RepID=A0A4R7RME1_9BACT|nr:LysM peptidoglycan-binding domain-containing protein [Prosthecobacter fusiformis]TDU66544.1 LysM domain-containing protein [Prosthecobacter fusiformis]
MAKAQLKLLLFLIVLGITLGCMAAAFYIYDKILSPDRRVQEEIAGIKKGDMPRMDPGAKRFDAAIDLIKEGRIEEGRDGLFKLINQFPDSPTCVEAKRIVGEINMDQLFAAESKAGKKDYIVQPGDSLALIAGKQGTTIDLLIRLNGLMSTMLQPGDHLTILPLDFSLRVSARSKTVSLWRKAGEKEYFFKEYQALDVRLPPSVRAPTDMEIKGKSAVIDGKVILSTDPLYAEADKWLPGSRGSVILRTPPSSKPAAAPAPEASPKAGQPAAAIPGLDEAPTTGVFLAREDLEEMFALVRNGSKLYFVTR